MKNMKKLLRKAMVFTLTAAMLVGTPLTASAASLVDLYKVEDGEGNVIPDQGDPNNSRTGTVTVTQTYTTTLEADNAPIGIYLDNSNVELEYPTPGSLTAKILWDTTNGEPATDNDKALEADMLKNLVWKSSNTEIVALNGKFNGGSRATIELNPKAFGTATVTVSLNSKSGKYSFSDTATVNVKQYATDLAFDKEIDKVAFVGDSIDLNAYVERYVDGKVAAKDNGTVKTLGTAARKVPATSDTLTFSLKTDSTKYASLKNGVLTIKKMPAEGHAIRILAIGQNSKDKVGTEWHTLTIQKGVNAKQIIFIDKSENKITKENIKVNDTLTLDVTAKVTKKDAEGDCTNKISWSSQKPEIVAIQTSPAQNLALNKDKSTVKLVAKSAGKAKIVAKTSNGKSATLTVTVSADLTEIKVTSVTPKKLYSGQNIDLYDTVDQLFGKAPKNFTDAGLKWEFVDKNAAKQYATLNAKGVLNIKPDLKAETAKIEVRAKNAKKAGDKRPGEIKAEFEISLEQVDVTSITVKDDKGKVLIYASVENGSAKVKTDLSTYNKKIPETVEVGQTRDYTLLATATKKDGTAITDQAVLKSVLGWSASGNGKIVKALRTTDAGTVKGVTKKKTATITVSAASKRGNTYKTAKVTFKDKVIATTKTLSLSVKNKGIAATGKNQTIKVTPVLEKGSTTAKGEVIWTATKSGETLNIKSGQIKNIKLNADDVGKEIVVTARVKNGPSATVKLPIVKQSKAVKFSQTGTLKITDKLPQEVTTTVDIKNGATAQTPGKDNVSPVTYTLSKTGVVRIKDLGDGKLEINPVTNGSVKITATTLDGKKKTLSVKVSNVVVADNFWKQNQ